MSRLEGMLRREQSLAFQGVLVALQSANFTLLPPKVQPYAAFLVALLQAALAFYVHSFNPDGGPATTAYAPESKAADELASTLLERTEQEGKEHESN